MKKLCLLLLTILTLSACDEIIGPVGPPGAGMNWNIEYIEVQRADWQRMPPNSANPNEVYYRCIKKFRNITDFKTLSFIYNNGKTSAYLYHDYGSSHETQTVLPYVLNLNDPYNIPCTETWYCDFSIENIAFYVAYSGDLNKKPNNTVFRVVMNW